MSNISRTHLNFYLRYVYLLEDRMVMFCNISNMYKLLLNGIGNKKCSNLDSGFLPPVMKFIPNTFEIFKSHMYELNK